MPVVVITDSEYGDAAVESDVLEGMGVVVRRASCLTADDVIEAAHNADALLVQYAPITGEVFDRLPRLRLVSRYGTGYDNVDVDAATAAGVWVANVPVYGSDEVAVHTLALLLACARGFPYYEGQRRRGSWPVAPVIPPHPRELAVGVLGAGRIGRRVIELARPLFGAVRWHDPNLAGHIDGAVRADSLEELLVASNVLTVHLPLDRDTHHLITGRELRLLREPRILVNAARVAIVDQEDLRVALDDGVVWAAGLDVWEPDPAGVDGPIFASDRVIATPHAAWASREAMVDVRRRAAMNVAALFRVGRPVTPVNEGTVGE